MTVRKKTKVKAFDRATQHERKREAVVVVAAQAFHENGYSGTTLDDIASRLGVTKKALYHYVSGKQEILFEIFVLWLDIQEDAIEVAENTAGKSEQKIRTYGRAYLSTMFEQLVPTERIVGSLNILDNKEIDLIQKRRRLNDARIANFFKGTDADDMANWETKYAVHVLNGALDWMFKWLNPEGNETPAQAVDKVLDILMQGFTKRT